MLWLLAEVRTPNEEITEGMNRVDVLGLGDSERILQQAGNTMAGASTRQFLKKSY